MSNEAILDAIFEAERTLRRKERELLARPEDEVARALKQAVDEARRLDDRFETELRLERLADLCAQVERPEMVDALFAILDDESPNVRLHAAEALVDVAFDRYAEVARATERAVAATHRREDAGPLLQELPWVILEVGEPSARKLIGSFLEMSDANAVASAVEALATLGDPGAIAMLRPLAQDERTIDLEEEDAGHTLGALVRETIEMLESIA